MLERITATEIIKRSEQGISVQPFLVMADDGNTYFVKGFSRTLAKGLVSEALAAELGSRIGLPVPPWRIMNVPRALIDFSLIEGVTDLGGGPAFASRQVENASDLMFANLDAITVELKRKVLVFDWWIRNGDRGLGELGGNVNLILHPKGDLAVIDHNVAFDTALDNDEFRTYHVFRKELGSFQSIPLVMRFYEVLLGTALKEWSTITALLPEEWLYRDQDPDNEYEPTLAQRLELLERYRDVQFWEQL